MPLNHPASKTHQRTFANRIRDLLLYTAIAALLVTVLLLYAAHQAKVRQAAGFPTKWLGFSIMTGLVFLNAFRSHKAHWKQRRFWALLALFSAVHFGVGAFAVSRLGEVGLIDFAFATLLEYFALAAYLDHFLERKRAAYSRQKGADPGPGGA